MSDTTQQHQADTTHTGAVDQELLACHEQLKDAKDRAARLLADFENFKKRQEKERLQWERIAQTDVLRGLLDIIDNFDRALTQHKQEAVAPEVAAWLKGFELIDKSLAKYLQSVGVEEIKDISAFNPEYHEAVMHVQSADHASGDVVAILQKGYLFKGSVLRPAKVSIAQ